MVIKKIFVIYCIICCLMLLAFLNCSGGGGGSTDGSTGGTPDNNSSVSISISPTLITLTPGGSQLFSATVTGSTNLTVTWSVQEGSTGGSVTNNGTYTATNTVGTYHVIATSQADSSKNAIATITVTLAPIVSVTINPTTANLHVQESETFSATVTGSSNTGINWSIQEGAIGGAITNQGIYTAPTTTGIYHVVATSQVDALSKATATITVIPAAGTLDSSFGNAGKVITSLGSYNDFAYVIGIQPSNKIIVAGISYDMLPGNVSVNNVAFVRYNLDGSLDNTFTNGGIVKTPYTYTPVNAIAVQSDGKFLLSISSLHFTLLRYNENGTVDNTFGSNGNADGNFSNSASAYAIAMQNDGKIIAGGYSYNGTDMDFALVRLNTDGTNDTSFNGSGKAIYSFGSTDDQINSLAIQTDGKIVTAGRAYNNTTHTSSIALARYNINGTLDATFGSSGTLLSSYGTAIYNSVYALAIQTNGKIVVAGIAGNSMNNMAVARYNADGTPDSAFGSNGVAIISFSPDASFASGLVVQSDGKILLTGGIDIGAGATNYNFALARLNTDGSLDTSFNSTGKIITSIAGYNKDAANSFALQTDGKILVNGYANTGTFNKFATVRYWP